MSPSPLYPCAKPLKVEKATPLVESPGFTGMVRADVYERRLLVKRTWKQESKST